MRFIAVAVGTVLAAVFLFVYFPFRPWLSDDFGPDDSNDPGEDIDA